MNSQYYWVPIQHVSDHGALNKMYAFHMQVRGLLHHLSGHDWAGTCVLERMLQRLGGETGGQVHD
jgi:hypothetical protein